MADVIHTPSLWDYIAQAGDAGVQSFQQAKAYTDQKAAQQAGLATQLFNVGAINAEDLARNPMVAKVAPVIQPNKPQMQRAIAASPDVNPATGKPWSDEANEMAGFTPAWKKPIEQAAASDAQLTLKKNDILTRYQSGGQISDQEARLAGLPTLQDQFMTQDKILAQVGPKYADSALAPLVAANGNRIPERGWDAAVQTATTQYNADRQAHGLPPDPSASNYFASQILDRLRQQKLTDIEALRANNTGLNRMSPTDRMFEQLTGVVNSRQSLLSDMTKADPLLGLKLDDPTKQNDPSVIRYKATLHDIQRAQNAQAKLAGGVAGDLYVGDLGGNTPAGAPAPLSAAAVRAKAIVDKDPTKKDVVIKNYPDLAKELGYIK